MNLIRKLASSLRAKLIAMFIILTCIPLITVGLVSYYKSYNTVFANSRSSSLLAAEQLSRNIDNLFDDSSKLLELGNDPNVLHYLFSQADNYSDAKNILETMASYRLTYKYDNVLNITMTNLYGRGISERKGVFQLNGNLMGNPHFAYLVRHPDEILTVPSPGWSAAERLDGFQYQNHNLISVITTVKQRVTHETIGFIIIDMDDALIRSNLNMPIQESGFFYVADESGAPIYTPESTDVSPSKWPQPEQIKAMLSGANRYYIDSSHGKPVFIFAAPFQSTGWSLVGYVPLQEIMEQAHSIRQLIIVAVALSIIFAITLHYFTTNRLTRPIHVLKKHMQLAASGYLEAKVTLRGTDEIADLGNSFNIMLGKIKLLLEQSIREQQEIKKSEFRALQAQINPHFLYNTLDSIMWMAEAGKKEQVIQLVVALSKLFRISLSKGMDFIPIDRELEHLNSYLTIQQIRYRDILEYELHIEDTIKPYSILKMTLQPIVENALYHGLKQKRTKGLIRIRGYADHQAICFEIEDNGIGMPEDRLKQLRHDLTEPHLPQAASSAVSGGFGLHNVYRRIQLYYGQPYGVHIESTEQAGTKVTIRIPQRME
ncbi:cache domain-containing sensor histidine kinase [Paenibacillus kobensis]|uniref:cache domain-containing sensor histidine kinase n=1 Tax=Paenibacillus kobensis TaxID=59841 RepID=UPI000FDA3D38|nr:sensor histidine kinase [Paenibacillus kobensis]